MKLEGKRIAVYGNDYTVIATAFRHDGMPGFVVLAIDDSGELSQHTVGMTPIRVLPDPVTVVDGSAPAPKHGDAPARILLDSEPGQRLARPWVIHGKVAPDIARPSESIRLADRVLLGAEATRDELLALAREVLVANEFARGESSAAIALMKERDSWREQHSLATTEIITADRQVQRLTSSLATMTQERDEHRNHNIVVDAENRKLKEDLRARVVAGSGAWNDLYDTKMRLAAEVERLTKDLSAETERCKEIAGHRDELAAKLKALEHVEPGTVCPGCGKEFGSGHTNWCRVGGAGFSSGRAG